MTSCAWKQMTWTTWCIFCFLALCTVQASIAIEGHTFCEDITFSIISATMCEAFTNTIVLKQKCDQMVLNTMETLKKHANHKKIHNQKLFTLACQLRNSFWKTQPKMKQVHFNQLAWIMSKSVPCCTNTCHPLWMTIWHISWTRMEPSRMHCCCCGLTPPPPSVWAPALIWAGGQMDSGEAVNKSTLNVFCEVAFNAINSL